jgi:hypothetical protein
MPSGGTSATERLAIGEIGALDASAFRWVFVAAAALLVAAFGCVLAIEERPLRGATSGLTE